MTTSATRAVGEAAEHPLAPGAVARALIDLCARARSGFLRVRHGDDEVTVTIVKGELVNARSNLRQHTLGSYLVSIGRLTENQVFAVDEEMRARGARFGEAAARLGLMTAAEAVQLLQAAVAERICNAATWSAGIWQFFEDAERAEGNALCRCEVYDLVFSGYLRHGDVAEAVRIFGEHHDRYVCATPSFLSRASQFLRLAPDSPLPDLVRRAPLLNDLLIALQGRGVAGLRELCALWATDLIAFEASPGAAIEAAVRKPSQPKLAAQTVGLEGEAQPVVDFIFAEYLRCQGADCYGVLGVERGATAETIAAVSRRLLARLSAPDVEAVTMASARARLEEIRGWVRNALQVLTDPGRRQVYDRALEAVPGVAPAGMRDAESEEFYRQGQRALASGDLDLAVGALRQAVQRCPADPDYAAALGWAETRRAASEAQAGFKRLREVCERNPHAARAHLYLGLVFEERGDLDLARSSLQRAVEIDPRLSDAQQALARVSGSTRDLYQELFGDRPFA
ncbi:MAG: hypothetical protein JXR83_16510 [Deltaproteobacteria bacterium]|nr:hypothetical protein [Deltaproteobacteria bacterium]